MLHKVLVSLLFFTVVTAAHLANTSVVKAANVQQTVPAEVRYGFIRDARDPQRLIAVAYPNVSTNDTTISTASFTFMLPAGTVTTPAIPDAPDNGSFVNITGNWTAMKITASLYASIGFNPEDLGGYDIYQVVLRPVSASPTLSANQPLPLFSLHMPANCTGNNVQVLTNGSTIQKSLLDTLGANFNNQISISIDDKPASNLYAGNNPDSASFTCPLGAVELATYFFLPLINKN